MSRIQEYKRNLSLALQGRRYEEALAILGKLVSQAENQPAYHNQIGDIYLKTGKQTQAVDSFMRGVEGYQLLEMYPNGAALCKKVLRLEPMHKDAAWILGELKTRQGFLADGAEKMLEALHMFAEDPATTRDSILDKLNLAEQLQGGCLQVLEFAATTYAQFGESQSARGVTLRIADIEEREGNIEKATSLRAFAEQFVADETESPACASNLDQEPVLDQSSVIDQPQVIEQVTVSDQSQVVEQAPVTEEQSIADQPAVVERATDSSGEPIADIPSPIKSSVSEFSEPAESDRHNPVGSQVDTTGIPAAEPPPLMDLDSPRQPVRSFSSEDESLLETFDSGLPEVDVELIKPTRVATGEISPATGGGDQGQIKLANLIPRDDTTATQGGASGITLQDIRKNFAADPDDLEMTVHVIQNDSPAEVVDSSAEIEPVVLRFDENESRSLLHQILEETIQGGPITVGLTTTAGEAFQTDDIGQVLKEFRTRMAEQADNMALDERYQLGVSYMEMDLYTEALQEFQTTLDHPTLGKKSREWMGRCHLALDQPQEIISLLDPYLKREPYPKDSSIELYYLLGQAYQLLANNDLALDALSKVYSLNRDFRDVQNRLENLTVPG